MNNQIYEKPILEIENELKSLNEDVVFLMGGKGTGKTTIIDHFVKNNNFVINASVNQGEYIQISDLELFNLYHTCLIAIKIINNLEVYAYKEKIDKLAIYKKILIDLINRIKLMSMIGCFKSKDSLINPILLNNPDIIILRLLEKIDFIKIEDIKIIIDDFDKLSYSSKRYQKIIYSLLKNKLQLITTVSDESIINNPQKISDYGYVLDVDYSFDLETIKNILNLELLKSFKSKKSGIVIPSIEIFSDKFILRMIKKTNGDLDIMKRIIARLCFHIDELTVTQYESFLNDYIDYETKYYAIVTGNVSPIRKLYL